jgi:hypothetical protein
MATLTITTPASGGSTLTTAAASAGGDQYLNSGKEVLVVVNGGGSAIDVTQEQQTPCSDGFDSPTHDIVTSVAAGATEYLPPVSTEFYNDDNGYVQVAYSDTTSVTVGVLKAT